VTQGYFLIALGKKYIDECFLLGQTIRKQGDNRPIRLWIHPEDHVYADSKRMFDGYVYFEPDADCDIWKKCVTPGEKYCIWPRLHFDRCLPYDETIIVDSDVLCQYSADSLWKTLSKQSMTIRMSGRYDDDKCHLGGINEVSAAFGKHVPHVHGGFLYIRKGDFSTDFFNFCRETFHKYDEYKCKRMFRGGITDEIIFAIAHSNFDMLPLEFDDLPTMTFNYSPDIQIPSKLQTEGNQNIELSDYIPFVHMFDKMEGIKFQSLYHKIIG